MVQETSQGSEGRMQLLESRALPTACIYAWTPSFQVSCQLDC